VCCSYFATGDAQQTISFSYRLGVTTVHNIIKETCKAIWESVAPKFLDVPNTHCEWTAIADEFYRMWNVPNCVSAVDGKHIVIQAPPCSRCDFCSYKGTYSVGILAACDAHYVFTAINVGAYGRESDGGVFAQWDFAEALQNQTLNIPAPTFLPHSTEQRVPYVVVADNAFPLKTYLLKRYSGRQLPVEKAVFNYRLSRARRVIENAFGIMATRWRIFRRSVVARPENVVLVVKAACVLHNFLQQDNQSNDTDGRTYMYCPPVLVDSYDDDGTVTRCLERRRTWYTETTECSCQPIQSDSCGCQRHIRQIFYVTKRSCELANICRVLITTTTRTVV